MTGGASELTWLITGSSRGFGRALATAALEAGDQVVATARNPAQVADLVEQYPDRALAVVMDVTDQAAVRSASGRLWSGSAVLTSWSTMPAMRTWPRWRPGLGAGAVHLAQNYSISQLAEAGAWATVSQSADFDQEYPAAFPAEAAPTPTS